MMELAMLEFADASPIVDVDPAEYSRLLGYPRGHALAGRSLELAAESIERAVAQVLDDGNAVAARETDAVLQAGVARRHRGCQGIGDRR